MCACSSLSSIDPAIGSVIAAKESALQSQIAVALAEKALSSRQQQGDAIVQLIDNAANIGKAIGRGESFDAHA